jgi:hypothetical protein
LIWAKCLHCTPLGHCRRAKCPLFLVVKQLYKPLMSIWWVSVCLSRTLIGILDSQLVKPTEWMQPIECTQADWTQVDWTQVNALKWMHSSECTQVNALKWIHSSECTKVNALKWMHSKTRIAFDALLDPLGVKNWTLILFDNSYIYL